MTENFKDATGYENYFQISNTGRVFSKRTNKLLKLRVGTTGYSSFYTKLHGRSVKGLLIKVHRLVAQTFITNPENKPQVNHIDGNKTNNNVENLEWCTASENIQHAHNNGLITCARGEQVKSAKLTWKIVEEIKKMYVPKLFGSRKIAKVLGLNRSLVDSVVRGITWTTQPNM